MLRAQTFQKQAVQNVLILFSLNFRVFLFFLRNSGYPGLTANRSDEFHISAFPSNGPLFMVKTFSTLGDISLAREPSFLDSRIRCRGCAAPVYSHVLMPYLRAAGVV